MCATCGCSESELSQGHESEHQHVLADGRVVTHTHASHGAEHEEHTESGRRTIRVEQELLGKNDRVAALNRQRFEHAATFVLNLMSSPGSGKTTLLVRTIKALGALPMAVIEGDQQTDLDARRIAATGVSALQINTGKGCHLDAAMVSKALDRLSLPKAGILFIENVGNLVCPASFDLGETRKVVVASITEGEDKPLKYPEMFARADLVLLNKIDLLPYVDFDVAGFEANLRRVRPNGPILRLSAKSDQGLELWIEWLKQGVEQRAGSTA